MLLNNLNQNLISEIGNLRLVITTILHLDNPELKLFGDFLFLWQIYITSSMVKHVRMSYKQKLRHVKELKYFFFVYSLLNNILFYVL